MPLLFRKICAPIEIKSALPPQKKTQIPPPLKGGILWTWVFLQKERIFPGVHKIDAPISGPRIADKHFTDTRFFFWLVLSSKNWKNIRDGGQHRKINPKGLGPAFSLCCRAGRDAALVKADFFFAGAPTIENKIEQKHQDTKVASAKVAFDTVWDLGLVSACCLRGESAPSNLSWT